MKKSILLLTVLLAGVFLSSFNKENAPKLYPELEAYFKSIDVKQAQQTHVGTLENIKDNLNFSNLDYTDWNIIFYCNENSFRSQASQVFLQTLCFVKKHKRVNAFSAGKTATQVSPKLIAYLSKIGYKVTKMDKNGQSVYEVKFSDNAAPVLLFSKMPTDGSLPAKDITSVIVCDSEREPECKNIPTANTSPFKLPFEKITELDADEKAAKVLKDIATEMLYVTQKK